MGSTVVLVSQLVPPSERSLVRARAHRLHRLAVQEPGVARRLRRRVCVQVAAIAPQLAFDRLSLLMRCTLWSYRLDDRVEALGFDVAGLGRLRDAVVAVAGGDQINPADPLLADLERTIGELARYDRTGDAVTRYGEAVGDAVAAEIDQRRLERSVADGSRPPTAERYLEIAIRNMNYRGFAYALLALGGDRLVDAQLRCVDAALWHASHAVRFGNDLRGIAQDKALETLNVVGLRTAAGEAVTPRYVWTRIDHHVRSHDTMLHVLNRLGVVPEASMLALTRSLSQCIRHYEHADLR